MEEEKGSCSQEEKPEKPAPSPAWALTKRVARIAIGIILIVLGLAALVTPFTPGSWLAVIGLEFLGLRVLLRDRVCARAKAKPESRFWRALCRILSLGDFEAIKRRWKRRQPPPCL